MTSTKQTIRSAIKLQQKLDARHAKDQKRVATTKKKLYGKVMQKKKSLGKFFMHRGDLISKLNKTNKNLFIKRKTIQTVEGVKRGLK